MNLPRQGSVIEPDPREGSSQLAGAAVMQWRPPVQQVQWDLGEPEMEQVRLHAQPQESNLFAVHDTAFLTGYRGYERYVSGPVCWLTQQPKPQCSGTKIPSCPKCWQAPN